jgi:uncharacterized protein
LYLLVTFYGAMVVAGWIVEFLFSALGLIPDVRNAKVLEASVTWNYTTVLNILFLVLAGILVIRSARTGVLAMLRMMGKPPEEHTGNGTNVATGEEHDAVENKEADAGAYECPMHPEVRSNGPGRCSKCGMSLEAR